MFRTPMQTNFLWFPNLTLTQTIENRINIENDGRYALFSQFANSKRMPDNLRLRKYDLGSNEQTNRQTVVGW